MKSTLRLLPRISLVVVGSYVMEMDRRAFVSNSSAGASDNSAAESAEKHDPRLNKFLRELSTVLNENQIDRSDDECILRGKPWNSYHKLETFPEVIVYPESTNDVSNVVRVCRRHNIPLIPFGGGTSLEGQTLAPYRGVSLDFQRMKRVVALHEEDLDVQVEAGLGYVELNEQLKDKKLWFPLDPGPGASIGGMCACRCSGSTAVRYGSMRENVLNVTAVLADGTIIRTGSRARKSSAGYDLTRLLIGSEGTLAIITEATLKIYPIPQHSYALRVSFPTVKDAAAAAKQTLLSGLTVGRCEMLDDEMVKIINASNVNMKPWSEKTTLMFELTGPSSQSVREQLEILERIVKEHRGDDCQLATEAEETKALWRIRKEALWSIMSRYPDHEPMITDICVPLSALPEVIETTKQALQASVLPCPIVAHAGDGNFHVIIMFRPSIPEEVKEAKRLANDMVLLAIAKGGTCTGEHGVGVGKKQYLPLELGEGSMRLMKDIKHAMDPAEILNPGKIL